LIASLLISNIALEKLNALLHAFVRSYYAGNNAITASPSYCCYRQECHKTNLPRNAI